MLLQIPPFYRKPSQFPLIITNGHIWPKSIKITINQSMKYKVKTVECLIHTSMSGQQVIDFTAVLTTTLHPKALHSLTHSLTLILADFVRLDLLNQWGGNPPNHGGQTCDHNGQRDVPAQLHHVNRMKGWKLLMKAARMRVVLSLKALWARWRMGGLFHSHVGAEWIQRSNFY